MNITDSMVEAAWKAMKVEPLTPMLPAARDRLRASIKAGIEAALAAAPAPSGWIACSERMPPQGEEVLVWQPEPSFKGGAVVALDKWDEQYEAPVSFSSATIPVGLGWDSGVEWEHITHWMPLPGAPGDAAPAPAAEAGPVAWAIRDAIDGAIIDVVMPDDDMLDELSPQHKTPLFAAPPPAAPTEHQRIVSLLDSERQRIVAALYGEDVAAQRGYQAGDLDRLIARTAPPPSAPQPEAQPVAVVTECEACFTPDVCQLRGKCDHYSTDWLRVAPPPSAPCPHIRSSGTGEWATNWCALNGPPSAPEPSEAEVAAAMASLHRAMEPAAWPSEDEITDALRAAAAARNNHPA